MHQVQKIIRVFKRGTVVSSEFFSDLILNGFDLLLRISDLGQPNDAYKDKYGWN
jgi:hypothetical protein